ncbi:DMT family transporter [Neotabrizicola sp. sgz301269]|uniref:DMT family transporter n=1 Tax=Neotabrizicola sp. sgz301269 TaxID=3276282 RepID=UPI00377008F4
MQVTGGTDLGRPAQGVAWMVLSTLAFVGVNGIVKHLGTDLPAAQSAFLRFALGVFVFLPMLPGILRTAYPATIWRLFLLRGVLHVAAVLFWFYAMARVPVAEMSAIGFLNPVLVLIIAGLLLGEGLSARRVAVAGVALVGAVMVLRPGFREISEGHMAQLAATLCFAAAYICAKRLSLAVPAGVVVAMMSFSVTLGLLPMALWVWVPVSLTQILWLALVALLATLAHYAMTRAFQAAPLAVTQPVIFLQIIWASLLGVLVFDEGIDPWVIAGGGVIVAAVSINTLIEARRGRRRAAEAMASVAP